MSFFIAGWLLLCLGFVSYPNFQYILPEKFAFPFPGSLWLIVAGAAVLFAAARRLPEPANPKEAGGPASKIILALILVLAAVLRLYRPLDPPGNYWDDIAMEIINSRNVLDFGEHRLVFPPGCCEPFFVYFAALVWMLLPDATGLFVQRLSGTLINLITLWILYLLGKELAGRRAGLLAAALGAMTQPFIIMGVTWMRIMSLPLAVSLCLLVLFKAVRRPGFMRFLLFGTVMGLGYYTYTPFRTMVPFLFACLLLAVLRRPDERKGSWQRWAFLAGSTAACGYLYLKLNGVLVSKQLLPVVLSSPWFQLLFAAGLFLLLVPEIKRIRKAGNGSLSLYLIAAFLWCQLLSLPTNQGDLIHKLGRMFLKVNAAGIPAMAAGCVKGFAYSVKTLFIGGINRGDQGVVGDAFFDFPTVCVLAMGIVFAAARPDWKKVFLLLAAVAGLSPWILTSNDPESGKLMGCVPPLLLLGAIALNRFLDSLAAFRRGGISQTSAVILLAALGTMGSAANFHKIYDQWVFNPVFFGCNTWVARQTAQDLPRYRVYVGKAHDMFTGGPAQCLLQDGKEIFILQGSNPVYLAPGEEPRDVVAILAEDDDAGRNLIRRDFPGATWSEITRAVLPASSEAPFVYRALIPAASIREKPGKFFFFIRQAFDGWKRRYYSGHYGLARGTIDYEDRVADLSSPPPAPLEETVTCRISGAYRAVSGGAVVFSTKTYNHIRLKIDGKTLFDLKPPRNRESEGSGAVNLDGGMHRVEITVYFRNGVTVSPIQARTPDGRTSLL